ncbi:MAG: prepilin-type N-terminal cleavage/methylation domain-containing protein, partial [Candidatus Gastranaerophilaceae bacterium]
MTDKKLILSNKRTGFTLAEILITLTIIGIVASMTIPSLLNKTNGTENVVLLKKSYATLSNAITMLSADNGSVPGSLGNAATNDDMANVFISKLNIIKSCGTNATAGCFPNITYNYLNGTPWENVS